MIKNISWKDVDLKYEVDVLADMVNPKYGIVKSLININRYFEDANMYFSGSVVSRPWNTGLFPGTHFITEGTSVHEDILYAAIGGVGESLERYCGIFYNPDNMVFGSYNDLNGKGGPEYINPELFSWFSKEQNSSRYEQFGKDSRVNWMKGLSLYDDKIVMVPAQHIFLPYFNELDEDSVFQSISTGFAFGISLEDTILSGLCETVERDSFSIYWLNKLELPRIKMPFGHKELDDWYAGMCGELGNEVNLYDITTDVGIPTFVAFIKGRPEFNEPFISVGASASVDPVSAVKKALMEAFHTRKYGFSIKMVNKKGVHSEIVDTQAMENNAFMNHVAQYLEPLDIRNIEFMYSPESEVSFQEVYDKYKIDDKSSAGMLKTALSRLAKHNYYPVAVDVTTSELREKLFYSIKTIVPGLHPLWAGDEIPLGGKRIYEVPEKLGFKRKKMSEMNTFPHPFP